MSYIVHPVSCLPVYQDQRLSLHLEASLPRCQKSSYIYTCVYILTNPLTRLPITGHILARVCSLLTKGVFGPYMDLLLQAACSLAFFAFLRCGKFTSPSSKFDHTKGLSFSDFTFTYEGQIATKLILNLKSSKTDPFRKGCTIVLFPTGAQLCPVRNMLNFMKVRAPFVLDPSEPLFMTNDRVPLTRGMFVDSIRQLLCRLGLNPSHYAGHSLRIGAATSAAESNIPDHLIKTIWAAGLATVTSDTSVLHNPY